MTKASGVDRLFALAAQLEVLGDLTSLTAWRLEVSQSASLTTSSQITPHFAVRRAAGQPTN